MEKIKMKYVANLLKNFIPYFEKNLPSQNMKIFKNICGEIWSENLECMGRILDDKNTIRKLGGESYILSSQFLEIFGNVWGEISVSYTHLTLPTIYSV